MVMMNKPHYIIGLDLGQAADFTALVILECAPDREPPGLPVYSLRHLHRFPLGTPYPEIVQAVVQLLQSPALIGCDLVVDQTGVGRAVVDLFADSLRTACCNLHPITITAGQQVKKGDGNSMNVPKKDLVGTVRLLLQAGRLKIAQSLPLASLLAKELLDFRLKITPAANEIFEARQGAHDDLVLAVALACWFSQDTLSPMVDHPIIDSEETITVLRT
jgi:hypothetical protein